jgi:metal-dependent HD superfamily phosphatase/phosphodiesterase
VIADTGSNAVKVMLPDARTLVDGTQIHIYGKDATTFALTVESPIAAQTLDGTDISSGGTPLATLNADDDYIVIEMRSNLWTTQVDGIS